MKKFDLWSRVLCGGDGAGSGGTSEYNRSDVDVYSNSMNQAVRDMYAGGYDPNSGSYGPNFSGNVETVNSGGQVVAYQNGVPVGQAAPAGGGGGITEVPTGTVAAPAAPRAARGIGIEDIGLPARPATTAAPAAQPAPAAPAPAAPTGPYSKPNDFLTERFFEQMRELDSQEGARRGGWGGIGSLTEQATEQAYADETYGPDPYAESLADTGPIGQNYVEQTIAAPRDQGWSAPAYGDQDTSNTDYGRSYAPEFSYPASNDAQPAYDFGGIGGQSYPASNDAQPAYDFGGMGTQSYPASNDAQPAFDLNSIGGQSYGYDAPQYEPDTVRDIPDPVANPTSAFDLAGLPNPIYGDGRDIQDWGNQQRQSYLGNQSIADIGVPSYPASLDAQPAFNLSSIGGQPYGYDGQPSFDLGEIGGQSYPYDAPTYAPAMDLADPMEPDAYAPARGMGNEDMGITAALPSPIGMVDEERANRGNIDWDIPAYGDQMTNAGWSTRGVPASGANRTLSLTPADVTNIAKVLGKEGLEQLAVAHQQKYGGTIEDARRQAALAHASVITNRAIVNNQSITDVLTAYKQFSPLNNTRLENIPRNRTVEDRITSILPDLPKYALDTQYMNFLNPATSGQKAMREWGANMPVGTIIGNPDARFSHSFGNASGKAVPEYNIAYSGSTYTGTRTDPRGYVDVNDFAQTQPMSNSPVRQEFAPQINPETGMPREYSYTAPAGTQDRPADFNPNGVGISQGLNLGRGFSGTAGAVAGGALGSVAGPLGSMAGGYAGRELGKWAYDTMYGAPAPKTGYTDYGLALNPYAPMNTPIGNIPNEDFARLSAIKDQQGQPIGRDMNPMITGGIFLDQLMEQTPSGNYAFPESGIRDPRTGLGTLYGAPSVEQWEQLSGVRQAYGENSLAQGVYDGMRGGNGNEGIGVNPVEASPTTSSTAGGGITSTTAPNPIAIAGQNVKNRPVFPDREVPEPYRSMLIQSGYGLDGLGGWNFFPESGNSRAIPMATGGLVQGRGTETSDSVPAIIDGTTPAALSAGEFVFTGAAVRGMGGGDRMEGARRLHAMMKKAERAGGK